MKLSIVIPHHNGKKLIFECLESLFRNTSIQNFETIVVDNLSTDNSADQAKENLAPKGKICDEWFALVHNLSQSTKP